MSRTWRSRLSRLTGLGLVAALAGTVPAANGAERDLLVSSRFTDRVLRYDGVTGAFLGEFVPAGSGGLETPAGILFGPDGNLYVAVGPLPASSGDQNRVIRYDGATGAFIDHVTPLVPVGILNLLFGPDGSLYGSTGGTVFRVDGTTGAFIEDFVDLGPLELATGLAFGPDGDLYVGSWFTSEVVRCDVTTGAVIDVFADTPLGQTGFPGVVIFGPDGNLYVGLPFDGDDVLRFDGTTGALLGSFIPPGDPRPDGPMGMVFGPDGNLYVASRDTDEVLRYDGTTGAFIDVFASGGGLDNPTGIVFTPEPGQVLLVAAGALVLAAAGRRRGA